MPHTVKMSPENIAEYRNVRELFENEKRRSGMTHATLGKMIGKSPKTVSAIVNARMRVTIDMGRKLARVFGVPLVQILPWTANLTADGDYADIIDDLQDLDEENQKIVRRMIRNLLDSQDNI
ncbi:helix-turn-helix transcriptional regulator [uncultured Paraglaciecola sp.]|uniref:helix-turn-helix transcriptional regulator n=1 Tax=uncultured Paraglaciecola sp. TaxID=1765024 RepID=UPI002602717E|nr:helix-turn-helix transcriptional regulator [uncultured Paraglaciecola sp.]